jgi:hypothetical protein
MSADEAQGREAPVHRGRRVRRQVASVTKGRARRSRLGGPELTDQLNQVVAELIKENRRLKREVLKLTERGTKVASSTVDRTLRTIQRRVQRALAAPVKRRRKKVATSTKKKTVARRRRKAT